jgi:hypothetical protein
MRIGNFRNEASRIVEKAVKADVRTDRWGSDKMGQGIGPTVAIERKFRVYWAARRLFRLPNSDRSETGHGIN